MGGARGYLQPVGVRGAKESLIIKNPTGDETERYKETGSKNRNPTGETRTRESLLWGEKDHRNPLIRDPLVEQAAQIGG